MDQLRRRKNIRELPKDIYAVMENGCKFTPQELEGIGKAFVDLVSSRMSPDERKPRPLSMSSFGGPCDTKQWFQENDPEAAEQIEGRALFNFLYGDVIELLVLTLAKKAGYDVRGEQSKMEYHGLKGHRDAIVEGMVCDVKSANTRSITKFKEHKIENDDPFGYLDQLSLYIEASQDDPDLLIKGEGAFIAVDKELGHIYVDIYKKKDVNYATLIEDKRRMLASDSPPPRPYNDVVVDSRSGNRAIERVPCGYCQFKSVCWKEANSGQGLLKVVNSQGPRWYTQINRTPAGKTDYSDTSEKGSAFDGYDK